jgi:iron complex outermembrane recepter protein
MGRKRGKRGIRPAVAGISVAGLALPLVLAIVQAFALPLVPGVALAQAPPSRPFRIDPQPVSSALRAFAEQAQVQLIFSDADVSSLSTAGVAGEFSPREALDRLLRGTPLEFELTRNNVAVVRKARPPLSAGAENKPGRPERRTAVGPDLPSPAESDIDTASLLEVTVTGSRILRRDLDAASPVFTVEEQAFEESSTLSVESVLNQLPQFAPAQTQFDTTDIFPTAVNTPGIATLNLRGLATNRTLVLIDGRRAQPANSTLVIDINSIPSSAISRVEIITGGASAIYGADAMSGVTNFKLRDNFEGATFEIRSGITEAGDGAETRLSSLIGANLAAGRGNVMLGIEWTKRQEAGLFGRPFFENALTDPGAPATSIRIDYTAYEPSASAGGLPSQAAANALFPERPAGTNVNRSTSFYVNADSTIFKDTGALGYTGEYGQKFKLQPNGLLGENTLDELVSSPLTRYSVLGRGHYEITDRIDFFAQANFAASEVLSISQPSAATTGGFGASIPRDALHPVPAELAALLDSRGPNVLSTSQFDPVTGQPIVLTGVDANWRLGRPLDFLPTRQLRNMNSVYQILAGLRGELAFKDWTWEAYGTHGESKIDNEYIGYASLGRYRAVVQAPNYGRGYTQTGAGGTQITCTSGLPIFEQFEVSQDCIDAITVNPTDRTRLTQQVLEANLQGAVMELPAGEARAAVGATNRKNSFEFRPDAIRESNSTDAIREANSIIDIPVSTFSNARVRGSTEVTEGYAELLLPLLRDRPFVNALELELGARYSQYDTAGGVPTYKALFSWTPIEGVRFRGGYQLANRAPNINELFLSPSSVPIPLRGPDPCRADTRDTNGNHPDNPRRAEVQALCSAIIGTGNSTFDENPGAFVGDGRTDGGEIEVRSGNPDVKSEQGRTWTLGVVLKSPFEHALSRNLTFAIDWYQAKITEAIAQVGAQTTYDLCFNRDGISNPDYSVDDPNGMCRRIVRNGVTGDRFYVNSIYENLGSLQTSGVDVQANWEVAPAELGISQLPGSLSLEVLFNKLLDFGSQSFPTSEVLENKGTLARGGQFSYRAVTTLRYSVRDANVALTWRRLPSVRNTSYVTDPLTPFAGADSYSIFDLSAGWSVNPMVRLTMGIDNLLDRDPNRVGAGPENNGAGTTMAGFYDVLGRRYYAGIRLNF